MTDVIADMLTRIRNAISAKHETVDVVDVMNESTESDRIEFSSSNT